MGVAAMTKAVGVNPSQLPWMCCVIICPEC